MVKITVFNYASAAILEYCEVRSALHVASPWRSGPDNFSVLLDGVNVAGPIHIGNYKLGK